ncbi:cryptochrome/photolyase family protein [Actinomyces vulturis]|uniref:cryptochrome/photolyase family protein n=1 Tax=Actinomyces vulturis TaxID=1857645 RepID=UPI00082F05B9|nr:deoxyribodipyrimidine photo-lyase [Actinomyces vulturis]
MNEPIALWWIRDDIRLLDNQALTEAAAHGSVVAVYCLEEIDGVRPLGGASRWWLHHSLTALEESLAQHHGPLILREGDPRVEIPHLAHEAGASLVTWQRRYALAKREVDASIKQALIDEGIEAHSHEGFLLHEPWTIRTQQGDSFKVYTPFSKACRAVPGPGQPLPIPSNLIGPSSARHPEWALTEKSRQEFLEHLADWKLLPTRPNWAGGLRETWHPGEQGALERLDAIEEFLVEYKDERDVPVLRSTSRLSPHLRFGEISPRMVWQHVMKLAQEIPGAAGGAHVFTNEVLWREFAWHRLFHVPTMPTHNIRTEFDHFPWASGIQEQTRLALWQQGLTGIPIVDAGMRELWVSGWMHNRVRMIAGSFLVKNCGVHWRRGEEWFWDTLVDADEASNPFNWQWIAGTGDDAAPYFRIFNPLLQADHFDPQERYIRQWVKEYGTSSYPEPIVDLKRSRATALEAYSSIKGKK